MLAQTVWPDSLCPTGQVCVVWDQKNLGFDGNYFMSHCPTASWLSQETGICSGWKRQNLQQYSPGATQHQSLSKASLTMLNLILSGGASIRTAIPWKDASGGYSQAFACRQAPHLLLKKPATKCFQEVVFSKKSLKPIILASNKSLQSDTDIT